VPGRQPVRGTSPRAADRRATHQRVLSTAAGQPRPTAIHLIPKGPWSSRPRFSPLNHHHTLEKSMTLSERLEELVRAAFSGIWVQSFEHDDAVREIAQFARPLRWTVATWDIDRGMSLMVRGDNEQVAPTASDPL